MTALAEHPSGVQPNAPSPERVVIEPTRAWASLGLRELAEYRDLFYFLVWRDVKVRYKQTLLGLAWAVIQPLFTTLILTVFFGTLAGIGPQDGSYPLWCLCGAVIWTFFATGLTQAAQSLVGSAALVRKVYFPRLVVPLSAIAAGLPDLLVALLILLLALLGWGRLPPPQSLLLPAFLLLALATCLGVGCWLAALNARFRDIRFTVPFLVQSWMFCTPLAYESNLIAPAWQPLYGLNPMSGVVEGFRWCLLGLPLPSPSLLLVNVLVALLLLGSGLLFFRRMEENLADVV